MSYAITTTVDLAFDEAVAVVKTALAGQGFGVLTEIDLAATLKKKIDVDIEAQVILGACRPQLAYRALVAEESIGLLLPCNVVVRSLGKGRTAIEVLDPTTMVSVTGNEALTAVADDAAARLRAALDDVSRA